MGDSDYVNISDAADHSAQGSHVARAAVSLLYGPISMVSDIDAIYGIRYRSTVLNEITCENPIGGITRITNIYPVPVYPMS